MKNHLILLAVIISLVSCQNTNEEQVATDKKPVQNQAAETKPLPQKEATSSNTLCQINGKDWAYTKASGIVSTHRKTGERTALLTFTKKLEKGSETIQLYFDADSYELEAAALQLKFKKKEDKLFTCYYTLNAGTRKRNPKSEMSGNIDLSNPTKASGQAEVTNININYEKELLLDPKNATINVTGLKFKDIGYSDLDKVAKSFK